MNETFLKQAAAKGAKIKIAASIAERLYNIAEPSCVAEMQELAETPRSPNIARRKDIEPPKAAQKNKARAPRADPRQVVEKAQRLPGGHMRDVIFPQFACCNGPRQIAKRLALAKAEPTFSERFGRGLGDRLSRWGHVESTPIFIEIGAKALYQPNDDRHSSVDADLLERGDIQKRFEKPGESRRTHPAQGEGCLTQPRLRLSEPLQRDGIDFQTKDLL